MRRQLTLLRWSSRTCRQTSIMCSPSATCRTDAGNDLLPGFPGTGCQERCWPQSVSTHQYSSLTPDNLAVSQPNTVSLNWLGMQDLKATTFYSCEASFIYCLLGFFHFGEFFCGLHCILLFTDFPPKQGGVRTASRTLGNRTRGLSFLTDHSRGSLLTDWHT